MLVAIIVRIAQSLGLHRDGSLFRMSAFETEMRRRIWHEICYLDLRTAEDHGCDPSIPTISFDTQLPLNINDKDLSEDPNAPPPVPCSGFTEMTLALVKFEMLDCFRSLFKNEPGASRCASSIKITIQEKEEKIALAKRTIEEKYLSWLDGQEPLQKVVFVMLQVLVRKAMISLYHPLRHFKDGEFLSHEMKEKYVPVHPQLVWAQIWSRAY